MTAWIELSIILITISGIAIGRFPVFRMNRTTIALVGATALLAIQAISLEEAYRIIDMNTLVLLFSMMVINANLRLSGFFRILVNRIILIARTPMQLLVLIVFSSGILSGLFLNDTIVLVFTPLVIEIILILKRNPLPYLIALATSANVGSVATIVGNPQNMIIGVLSGIPFGRFLYYLTPGALIGLLIIVLIIRLADRNEFRDQKLVPPPAADMHIYRPLMIKSMIATVLMLIAFLAGVPVTLAALGAAALLLFTRRVKPERVFAEIDWSLLVFFASLFVITDILGRFLISTQVFSLTESTSPGAIAEFSIISVVLSNLISNVPAVLTLSPLIRLMADPERFWLMLALTSTFAGNLTLLGSVANLIVAELARKRGVVISFGAYLKVGLPVTIITTIIGVILLTLLTA